MVQQYISSFVRDKLCHMLKVFSSCKHHSYLQVECLLVCVCFGICNKAVGGK